MATTTFTDWLEHGWWIEAANVDAPMLWITERVMKEGQHWSALGLERGKVIKVTTARDDVIFISVAMEEGKFGRYKLQRQFMMAPIPPCCLDVPKPMKVFPKLQENWTSMPEVLRNTRKEAVERFRRLSPENILRAQRLLVEILAYEAMQRTAAPDARDTTPPRAPEETDPIYRVLATPLNVHWVPVRDRVRRRSPPESAEDIGTSRRNVRAIRGRGSRGVFGTQSSPRMDTSQGRLTQSVSTSNVGGISAQGEGNTPNSMGAAANRTSMSALGEAESSRASEGRSREQRSSEAARLLSQRGRGRGGRQQNRPRGAPITRAVTGRVSASGQGGGVEHGEEFAVNDDPSDEEEETTVSHRLQAGGPLVKFPTNEEYLAGYVWGMDLVFDVKVANIRDVENVETNHRAMTARRVSAMYKRLCGKEELNMSPLTLRPLAYILEGVDEEGAAVRREIPFSRVSAVKDFEAVYLHNASAVPGNQDMSRINWLQNNIIWEPVDGQHVVAACKQAEREHSAGLMEDEEYEKIFAKRKARFLVYNDSNLYIEASVRINAREFEREFYTTMDEDLMKLRAIWVACGRPNPEVRADDVQRARAVTMAASALHWTRSSGGSMSLGVMYKRMAEYTRHAWQADERAYEAVLQVCRDYENGILWYSKEDERKWKKYASQKSLDTNVDVREGRKRMERLWLRPLMRVPTTLYWRLAKEMAAKPIVDGERARQRFFFNGASSTAPMKGTLAWTTDRLQKKEAVRNAIRWLLVEGSQEHPSSMKDFLVIDVQKFEGERREQLNLLAEVVDKKMKKVWASPSVKTVDALRRTATLIPPMIRNHYDSIQRGESGYRGINTELTNLDAAQWDWQLSVPVIAGGENTVSIPIRCGRQFFSERVVQLGAPCLWIFDCRRCGASGENEVWTDVEYSTVLQKVQQWMADTHRWTAVFLFPPGIFFEEDMREKMALPTECTWQRGMWIFEKETVSTYVHDFRHDGVRQRSVQAMGGVAFIMVHPIASSVVHNVRGGHDEIPVVFTDSRSVGNMPCDVDPVERTPIELRRLIATYLPEKWGLIAVGITTALPTVLHTPFVGSQVIVLDGSIDRTRFLYNTMQELYPTSAQVTESTVAVNENAQGGALQNRIVTDTERVPIDLERRRAEEEESEGLFEEEDDEDEEGEDLHSEDTPVREGQEEREVVEDREYVVGEEEEDMEDEIEDESTDSEEEDSDSEDDSSDEDDYSTEEEEEVAQVGPVIREERRRGKKKTKVDPKSKGELGTTSSGAPGAVASIVSPRQEVMTTDGSTHDGTSKGEASAQAVGLTNVNTGDAAAQSPNMVNLESEDTPGGMQEASCEVEVLAEVIPSTEEAMIETEGSLPVGGTPVHVVEEADAEMADDAEESLAGRVPLTATRTTSEDMTSARVANETQLDRISFPWALQNQGMTEGTDGLFYDREGIKYRRTGVEGADTFEQVTSIMEETSLIDHIPSPQDDAVIRRTVADVELEIPSEIRAILNARPVGSEEGEETGTQSSGVIAETPEAVD